MPEKINIFKQDLLTAFPNRQIERQLDARQGEGYSEGQSERKGEESRRVALPQILEEIKLLSESNNSADNRIEGLENFVKDKISKLEKINTYINLLENQIQDFSVNQQKINEQNFKSSNYIAEKLDDLIGLVGPFKEKIIEHEQKLIALNESSEKNNQTINEIRQTKESLLESIKASLEASFEEKLQKIENKLSELQGAQQREMQDVLEFAPEIEKLNNRINAGELELEALKTSFENQKENQKENQVSYFDGQIEQQIEEIRNLNQTSNDELSQKIIGLDSQLISVNQRLEASIEDLNGKFVEFQNRVDQEVKKILVPLGNVGEKLYKYDKQFQQQEASFKGLEAQLEDFVNAQNESSANNFKKFNEVNAAIKTYLPEQIDKIVQKQLLKTQEESNHNYSLSEQKLKKVDSKIERLAKLTKLSKNKFKGEIQELRENSTLQTSRLPSLIIALLALLMVGLNLYILQNNQKDLQFIQSKIEERIKVIQNLETLSMQKRSFNEKEQTKEIVFQEKEQSGKANKTKKLITQRVSKQSPQPLEASSDQTTVPNAKKNNLSSELSSETVIPESTNKKSTLENNKEKSLDSNSISVKPRVEAPSNKSSYNEVFAKASRLYKNRAD
ncbi:MAG: hypothetical protein SFU25_07900 [Candidatus Caenarcaniphilales bacterium]|nr:hypothetical protein [Candidatus Caenarcaniphilales bacterium]